MGGAAVMPGNADGTFGPLALIPAGLTPNDAILGDFNGDGNIDVVLPGDLGYAVALGTGAGTFTRGPLMREATASYWAVVGDFNNDGTQDFTGAGGIFGHTYFGNGDGTFQAPIDANFSATSGTVSGDFNGDGNVDIAIISATPRQDGSNYGFKVAVGAGDGTFNPYLGWVLSQQQIGNLVTADFNGDGLTDLATSVSGTIRVFAGDKLRFLGGEIFHSTYVAPSRASLLHPSTNACRPLASRAACRRSRCTSDSGPPPTDRPPWERACTIRNRTGDSIAG